MNFNDLFQKMRELDAPVAEELKGGQKELDVDKDGDIEADDLKDLRDKKVDEELVDECGDMPMPGSMMSGHKQEDSISANISMNASGPGGIRDLMDILKNIENASNDEGPEDLEPLIDVDEAELANSPDPEYAPLGAAFPTGDDMHSKGEQEFPKANGGGNPMTMESLTNRLSSLYEEIKSR